MTADTITAIKKALEGVNAAFLRVLAEAPADSAHYSIGFDLEGSAIRITLEDMRTIASISSTLESLQRENEELRSALADLSSWFDSGPSIYGPWIIRSGTHGADEAAAAAREVLSSTGDTHGN